MFGFRIASTTTLVQIFPWTDQVDQITSVVTNPRSRDGEKIRNSRSRDKENMRNSISVARERKGKRRKEGEEEIERRKSKEVKKENEETHIMPSSSVLRNQILAISVPVARFHQNFSP